MKILHIARDRGAAELAARALHGIASHVTLTWTLTGEAALQWLHVNRNAAAVICQVDLLSAAAFVEQVRELGLTTPIVVVAEPGHLESVAPALNAGADGVIVADRSLTANLPRAVILAIDRERTRHALHTRALTSVTAEREHAKQELARAQEALRQAQHRSASDLAAAAERLAAAQARHTASVARDGKICATLQDRLFELERTQRAAQERSAHDAALFADQLAKRHAEFTASLAQATHSRDALAVQLTGAAAALADEQEARRAEATTAAELLRRRDTDLEAARAETATTRITLEAALARAESGHQNARTLAAAALAAANDRQSGLEDLLAQETDKRTDLENTLAAAHAAHQQLRDEHIAELTAAGARLADVQAQFDAAREEHAAARSAFERESVAAADRLARREAELGTELAAAHARGTELENSLIAANSAHQDLHERLEANLTTAAARLAGVQAQYDAAREEHAAARSAFEQDTAAAAERFARREAELEADLTAGRLRESELSDRVTRESDARGTLERDLAALRLTSNRGRRRSLRVVAAYRRRSLEDKARLEAELTQERDAANRDRHAMTDEIQQLRAEHETLRRLLAASQEQLEQLHGTFDEERLAHERARLAREAELERVSTEHGQLSQSFEGLQSAFQTLEQVAGEHAAERARLERTVADRDSVLAMETDRHRVAERVAQDAFAARQTELQTALDESGVEVARLRQEVDSLRGTLDDARARTEVLGRDAERVPGLRAELETSQKERRREFERAPYALCRCTPAGVITDANHWFVAMLGRRRVDEVRNLDFASAVFDYAGDVAWLLERARAMRKTETVETDWKTTDGRRLNVRLRALAAASGSVEVVVEDITGVRTLEERLRQAQRLEAVGRLASEVAVTCGWLLRDVSRGADEWLTATRSHEASRRLGERLVSDVARAASFLRQLEVYGHDQVRALEPVSVQRVLRDLAPVLKQVAGNHIELVLSKTFGSFDVDVETERLERVLVNVAAYARQRMPGGGQVRIDLATTAVGRRFVARYPNVRPGDHVLITVTELPGGPAPRGDAEPASTASERPGVDLGALVELVGTCGGHLWMEAQPAGNMMLKIHLPKRTALESASTQPSGGRSERGGRLARWFRSNSTTTGTHA